MAVGLALRRDLRTHDGAGTGLVLDEKSLPHAFREHVGAMPPDQIVAAARTDRHDDFNGVVGVGGLRLRHRSTETD
jgi:hypothetical protein